uniref:PMD domain-containing protein n=1 Tax=Caenorhabditis tropicalis TaxID=1561998 RepID=A0A1I7T3W1_9PELO
MHRLQFISIDPKFCSTFERQLKTVLKNNAAFRTKDEELTDLEYYGDDELLTTSSFSLKLDTVVQVPKFAFPKAEADGYFSPDRQDFEWYLFQKYLDANEQCAEEFAVIRPLELRPIAEGFELDTITPSECYKFHMAGRHIQGFFDVWSEKERKWQDSDGKWISRRYLVDMYNRIMFPLYVDWHYWPIYLKWSFDKYSLYGLRLYAFIKKYPSLIKESGERIFTPYPPILSQIRHIDLLTAKQIHHYSNAIYVENNRSFIRNPTAVPEASYLDEEIRRRKRKARYAEEEVQIPKYVSSTPLPPPPPASQLRPSPRQSIDSLKQVKQTPIKQSNQKENMEKRMPYQHQLL